MQTEHGLEKTYQARYIITSSNSLVGRHLAIRLDAMLQAEQLPAGVANLHAALEQGLQVAKMVSYLMPLGVPY